MKLPIVNVGDKVTGKDVYRIGNRTWQHVYEVLAVDAPSMRFGKPNQIVTVKITTSDTGAVVDHSVKRWLNQLV